MDFAAVPRPAFGRAARHQPAAPPPRTTRAAARHLRAAKTAADLLPDLPAPGDAIHVLMTGHYDLGQVIAATAARLPDCRHLRVATLCYSKRNAADLLALLDARGAGFRLTLLVSSFFRSHNKELHEWFAGQLDAHPTARMAAARSHCKVACFDLGPGDGLVFEGSANLRANGNREQLTATRDRPLHDFHAAFIDALVSKDHGEEV